MKAVENTQALADALKRNTVITRLVLRGCEINDEGAAALGQALVENHTIEELDLQHNRITTWGVISLTEGLSQNKGVTTINLLDQAAKFGDDCVEAFITVFSSNITLNKIMWQTESVRLWELSKLITRNVELQKRSQKGEDINILLPKALGGQGGYARVDVAAVRVQARKKSIIQMNAPVVVAQRSTVAVASAEKAAELEIEKPTESPEDDGAASTAASAEELEEPEVGKLAEPKQDDDVQAAPELSLVASADEAAEQKVEAEEAADPEAEEPTEPRDMDNAEVAPETSAVTSAED